MSTTTIPAYAHLRFNPTRYGDDMPVLTAVYKDLFDTCGVLDDGASDDIYPDVMPFSEIYERLTKTGIAMSCEDSEFEIDLTGNFDKVTAKRINLNALKQPLIEAAAKQGVQLIFDDPEFDKWMTEWD